MPDPCRCCDQITCYVDIVHVRLGNLRPDLGDQVQDELHIIRLALLVVNIPTSYRLDRVWTLSSIHSPAPLIAIRSNNDAVVSQETFEWSSVALAAVTVEVKHHGHFLTSSRGRNVNLRGSAGKIYCTLSQFAQN